MELGRFLGGLHPLFVHFPIVLLLLGVACDALSLVRRNDRLSWAGLWLTLLGTASMLVAFVCGILAECFAARAGIPQEPMEAHERFATATAWLFIALASIRLFMGSSPKRKLMSWYLVSAVVGCGLLVVTAYRGGHVVYEYGANVAGVQPLHGPSLEDLATIAQHQEQRTLTYSNQMHHIFGWLVLGLSVAVFCERLRLGKLAYLRWLMPLMFIGGGIYLFIFSDWDAWPLSDLRPITDAEVVLHKAVATIMFCVGVAALFRRGWRSGNTSDHDRRWAWQNKLIAVMALAGAGALFCHIHTNAPYTANAIGVYLNHTAMGLIALGVAASVLWKDARPNSRFVSLVLPTLLLFQSIFLLKYNEDLPWWLGYNVIDASPPRGGVLVHVPYGRAELVFDPESGTLKVFFYQARNASPILSIRSRELEGEIETPTKRVGIRFGTPPLYECRAPWLRQVPLFILRLRVPATEEASKGTVTVEFDPWVTSPILPPLVGAEKGYACPMCPDVLSTRSAKCPMCGMELIPVSRSRLLQKPAFGHFGWYRMALGLDPIPPHAEKPVRLSLTLHSTLQNDIIKYFQPVHERLMHLFIVSKDLSWFDHVHPELQPDGRFLLGQTFPFAGDFLLFADVTPEAVGMQIFRLSQTVEGEPHTPEPLQENASIAKEFQEHLISLRLTPKQPRAGNDVQLTFSIFEDGKPVDDLILFLGAIGHCVIVHEDTETFIHTHPVQLTAAPPSPGGPEVTFHAQLPKPGLYKVWVQFNHRGTIITADFVFRVR